MASLQDNEQISDIIKERINNMPMPEKVAIMLLQLKDDLTASVFQI